MTKVPEYLLGHEGAGKSKELRDNTFGQPRIPSEYLELLEELDRTRDPRLLLPYLKVPEAARPHFEDLFDRLEFKTRKGRRADAKKSYKPSDDLIRLKMARDQVRALRRGSMPREEAITKAIQQWRVDRDVLESALNNKHTALRGAFPNK